MRLCREVQGLRAVFGETYPDPVRIVSVGFMVKEVIADPANAKWATTSVEFCGGTYVLEGMHVHKALCVWRYTAALRG